MNLIKLLFLALLLGIPAAIVFLRAEKDSRRKRVGRAIIAIFAGYIFLNMMTNAIWDLSIRFATTEAEIERVCSHDGAPRAFALLFGWIPMAIYVGFLEILDVIKRFTRNRYMKKKAQQSGAAYPPQGVGSADP